MRYALRHPNFKSFSVAILVTTGLRVGELLALTLKDIDLKNKVLWIHQSENTKNHLMEDNVKEISPEKYIFQMKHFV